MITNWGNCFKVEGGGEWARKSNGDVICIEGGFRKVSLRN